MNESLGRNPITAVERTATRATPPVVPVPPANAGDGAGSADLAKSHAALTTARVQSQPADDEFASAAEYAKVHARIADILADMRSATPPSVDGAASAIESMLPQPIILVPLPPASREAVEHAAALAKRIAQQAGHAHAAQAHVRRGTADQIVTSTV